MTDKLTLKHYAQLKPGSFTAKVNGLIKRGPEQILEFQTLCANAIVRTIETNDVIHINRMVEAALACGRYRTFVRVVPSLVPFAWSGADKAFSGKRQKGKYNKLVAIGENGQHTFENLLVQYFGKEGEFAKQNPAKSWDLDASVMRLIKSATKHGKSFAQINKAVEKAERKLASA